MFKRKKFLISGLIVVLAIGYLTYMGLQGGMPDYKVSEFLQQGSSIYDGNARVYGQVAPGSVEQENAGSTLRFTITDTEGQESLPVVYQGVVPDTFKIGREVILEGHLNSDGVFQADTILVKCPSRYVPQ